MPVRARDLRANIKDYGFERGVVTTLEQLLDEFVATRQQLVSLAEIQNNVIDHIQQFLKMGEGLRRKLEDMERTQNQGDAIDHGDNV